MAYKKYIKRGDKIYGPYSYKSIKKDGKVITKYLGKAQKENRQLRPYFFLGILGIILLISLFVMIQVDFTFVGKVTLDLEKDYTEGQFLEGVLKFILEENELIPSSTKVKISLDNISYDYVLSDLISDEIVSGNFFIKNKNISGSGEGYGIVTEEIYPNVSFVLEIYSEIEEIPEKEIPEEPEVPAEEIPEEVINETKEEIPIEEEPEVPAEEIPKEVPVEEPIEAVEPEVPVEETTPAEIAEEEAEVPIEEISIEEKEEVPEPEPTPITGEIISGLREAIANFFLSMTGQVSLELKETIVGDVSKNKPFIYELEKGQTAKIASSSQDADLFIENNTVRITTDYEVKLKKELEINLTELNIPAKEGILTITLVYDDTELMSIDKKINVEWANITNVTEVEEILKQTFLTLGINKENYVYNETVDIFGELTVDDEKISDEISLEIKFNESQIFIANVSVVNGIYNYLLPADFEREGIYFVKIFYKNLSAQTSFYFLKEVTDLGRYNCKSFKENVLWSSGYTHSEEGSINYETWYPKYSCTDVRRNACIFNNINIKTRFRYMSPYDEVEERESFVQISEPDKTICNRPEKGDYSKYLAYDSLEPEEEKFGEYCGQRKNIGAKCGVEISDNYPGEGFCFGVKLNAAQYSMIDVLEIKYDLCWEKG